MYRPMGLQELAPHKTLSATPPCPPAPRHEERARHGEGEGKTSHF